MGVSELVDEIGGLVEVFDRAMSVLCRSCASELSNGRSDSLCSSWMSVVDSCEDVAGGGLS